MSAERSDAVKPPGQVTEEVTQPKDIEQRVPPDHFDSKYRTTRWETWAYYAWVNR